MTGISEKDLRAYGAQAFYQKLDEQITQIKEQQAKLLKQYPQLLKKRINGQAATRKTRTVSEATRKKLSAAAKKKWADKTFRGKQMKARHTPPQDA